MSYYLKGAQCPTHCGSQMTIIWRLHAKILKSVLTHSFESLRWSESPGHVVSLESPITQRSPLSLEGGEGNFSSFSRSSVFMQAVVCVCLLLFRLGSFHPHYTPSPAGTVASLPRLILFFLLKFRQLCQSPCLLWWSVGDFVTAFPPHPRPAWFRPNAMQIVYCMAPAFLHLTSMVGGQGGDGTLR